ncbi:hypothetical protein ACRQU7_14950 [Caproiciproducens sp. R1]|uniref:hypothetical protein n=1 Tax=Caproiciproducens sp. R1 TaxID=3435000 RepID=UPI0040339A2B
MNIMRLKNPIFILITLFFPWRFINTYIILEDNKVTFNRYYAINERQFRNKNDEITLGDIQEIGFSSEVKVKRQESVQNGAYGIYSPQEIDFKTKFEILALNTKPYTRKQIRYLIEFIDSKNKNVLIGKRLTKAIGHNCA